jgi:hypothetical protein
MEYITRDTKFKAIVWTPRVTGSVSAVGSLLTLLTLARTHPRKRSSVYNRIVAAMSIFDLIFSLAWAASRAVLPDDSILQLTHGSQALCTAQGFLLQLGSASFVYSMFLTVYYVLTIQYNIREQTLTTYFEWPVHVGTNLFFWATAIAAIPMDLYNAMGSPNCWFNTGPIFCTFFEHLECTRGLKADVYTTWTAWL